MVCLVALIATIFMMVAGCRSCLNDGAQSDGSKPVAHKPNRMSINRLITNDMSSLEQTKKFDKDIEAFMRRWELKGATFALMRNDSLIYAKGYGYANVEREQMCDAGDLFRLASVSKLITATAVMKLVEEGKLSLSAQVFGREGILNDTIFLNIKSRNLERITVEHLLRHTAGFSTPHGDAAFANYSVARSLGKELPLSLDDMVVYASQNRLRHQPGGSYRYSNLGYMVLTKIIEEVTGKRYESYVNNTILYPAGCYDMFIGGSLPKERSRNEVNYYEVKEAEPIYAYDGSGAKVMKSNGGNNITLLSGAGGWVASASELLKFVSAIDDCPARNNILSPESIKTMTASSKRDHPIGWASVHQTQWLRSGSMAGTSALIKKQSNGYTWVFISNSSAWIGPNITKYISSSVTRAVSRVNDWPRRDLFTINE